MLPSSSANAVSHQAGGWVRRAARCALVSALLVTGITLSGCIANPWTPRAPGPREPGPFDNTPGAPTTGRVPDDTPPSAPSRAWRKAVAAKEPPARLVAADGTSCAVSEERYARVAVGDVVWCIWEEPEARAPVAAAFRQS